MAIATAERDRYIESIMTDGYFRNAEGGYVFMDPYTGAAVAGPDGNPLIISEQEVLATGVRVPEPVANPDTQGYGRELEERARRDRELRDQGLGTGGWFNAVPDPEPAAPAAPPAMFNAAPDVAPDPMRDAMP
jgi:hypothetical protein